MTKKKFKPIISNVRLLIFITLVASAFYLAYYVTFNTNSYTSRASSSGIIGFISQSRGEFLSTDYKVGQKLMVIAYIPDDDEDSIVDDDFVLVSKKRSDLKKQINDMVKHSSTPLEFEEKNYYEVLASPPLGVLLTNNKGNYIDFNKSLQRFDVCDRVENHDVSEIWVFIPSSEKIISANGKFVVHNGYTLHSAGARVSLPTCERPYTLRNYIIN